MMVKQLGRTGVFIPEVGIGTSDYHAGPLPLRKALESGARFIDTAESYGTDHIVGEAVSGCRERVFIATKVSPENFRSADLRKSIDSSLKRLRTDFVDLLQLHRPNPAVPIQETMGDMADLVAAGKVKYVGVSNFSLPQLQEAQRAAGACPIVSNQVRYNLIDRTVEGGLLQYCQSNGVTVIAYSPLGRGLDRIRDCDPADIVGKLARETGKSAAQIVLNWCLCKDGVVAIPMSNTQDHLLEDCAASDWRLSAEQLHQLDSRILYRHRNRLDAFLRDAMPHSLQAAALRIAAWLPPGVRRRFT